MAVRCCKYCGKPLPVNVTVRCVYCPGGTCRKLAYKQRRKTTDTPKPDRSDSRTKTKKATSKSAPLTGREFERMMDGKLEDVLRHNRDRLQAALDDPGTPATALPAISRQLIAVCRELDNLSEADPLLDFDDDQREVTSDVGASIV